MVAIASQPFSSATAQTPLPAAAARADTSAPAKPAGQAAAVVELSDSAKAIIAKAKDDQTAAEALTETFDERLAKRTDALSDRLSGIFGKMNIPPEYATHMKVDKFGTVTAEGPWKDKIEKMFSDSPDLAKELKEVSGLNSLKAAQASLDLYNAQKKSTSSETKQAEAWKNYNIRGMNIESLSGVMTMKDGKLRSAAVDYMDMLTDPTGIDSATSRQDFANRLA